MPRRFRRGPALLLAAGTSAILVLDLAGAPGAEQLRTAGAAVLGPLERVARTGFAGPPDPPATEMSRFTADMAEFGRTLEEANQLRALLDSPSTRRATFVPARVVAVGTQGPAGPERVTIDAGSRDGMAEDLTVVSAQGLVGRVVSTGPWTSDVLLVGSAGLTVGVRVGRAGTLGSLTGAAGDRPRPAGQLGLQLVQRGAVAVGDAVTTMGSAGGRPFVRGIRVGTVSAVDPAHGQVAPTAVVTPAVDVTTLDVVGVLVPSPRTAPRAPVQGGQG